MIDGKLVRACILLLVFGTAEEMHVMLHVFLKVFLALHGVLAAPPGWGRKKYFSAWRTITAT